MIQSETPTGEPLSTHERLLAQEKPGSWRYAAVLHRHDHVIDGRSEPEYQWAVHELYTFEGPGGAVELSWTAEPVNPTGGLPGELTQDLERMRSDVQACPWLDLTDEDRPVLREPLAIVDPTTVLVEVRQTCLACPTQFQATASDGTELYLRFRHRHGYVRIDHGADYGLGDVVVEFDVDEPHGPQGSITLDEFCDRAGLLLADDAAVSLMELEEDPCDTSLLDTLLDQSGVDEQSAQPNTPDATEEGPA